MTTLQIHMTMAALGVAVCLAFLALVSYRHYPAFKRTLLGFVIGGLVALSPFIASLGGYVTDGLLPKSMVLSFAAVLSGLLIYTLSRWPVKEHQAAGNSNYNPTRTPVVLKADANNAIGDAQEGEQMKIKEDTPSLLLPDTTVEGFPTLELNQETENDPIYDVSDEDIFEAPETTKMPSEENKVEDTFDIDEAFAKNVDANTNDFAVSENNSDGDDIAIDNSTIFELTGQHEIPSDVGVPLPETAQKSETAPVESENEIEKTIAGPATDETQPEIGFDTDDLSSKLANNETDVFDDTFSVNAVARSVELDAALQGKLDELDATLSTLDTPSTAPSNVESDDTTQANPLMPAVDAESLAEAESSVNTATESLMALQRQVVEQNKQQQQLITELQERSAEQLEKQRGENIRIRELIENTSKLTREMVDQQQSLRDAVAQEKASRLKSEASAKQSLEVAQSAIARLSKSKAASRVNAIKFKSD